MIRCLLTRKASTRLATAGNTRSYRPVTYPLLPLDGSRKLVHAGARESPRLSAGEGAAGRAEGDR